MVKKKINASGKEKCQLVVDFRALNEVTINEMHSIPYINEILDKLGQSEFFTTIDLASGCYQIPQLKSSWERTAFPTAKGHYQFKILIMGLKISPATLQRLMNNVLSGIKGLVYLNDIVNLW